MPISAFPLQWPLGFNRFPARERDKGAFKTTLSGAIRNVQDSLRRFAADSGQELEELVISSNVTLGVQRPDDPGVSVWFNWEAMQVCIAVDRYTSVEANLQAIHHIVEARRTELRHGTLALVRATFQGFKALPAPDWRGALGLKPDCSIDDAERAYKRLRSKYHPDKPDGNTALFNGVNEAWLQARAALEAP
jgi:hypothetical protein